VREEKGKFFSGRGSEVKTQEKSIAYYESLPAIKQNSEITDGLKIKNTEAERNLAAKNKCGASGMWRQNEVIKRSKEQVGWSQYSTG
jgi:hypothetical protein